MCDASDHAIGVGLGQRHDKIFRAIYYASKTLNDTQENYTTTKKEMLAVIYSCDKFRPYIIRAKVVIYTNHVAIKYLMFKNDAKPRLIRWLLLLRGFNVEIGDKKGTKNVVVHHLSILEAEKGVEDPKDIDESFSNEQLFGVDNFAPWYANIVNFLACKVLLSYLTSQQIKNFLHEMKCYQWDDPLLFQRCVDQMR